LLVKKPPALVSSSAFAACSCPGSKEPVVAVVLDASAGLEGKAEALFPPAWAFSSVGQVPAAVSAQELRAGGFPESPSPSR